MNTTNGILVILSVYLALSIFFIIERQTVVIGEIEYRDELRKEIKALEENPCPSGYWYYVGWSGEGCVPEKIINPANTNVEQFIKNYKEWEIEQIKILGCGTGMNEINCWHQGDYIGGLESGDLIP